MLAANITSEFHIFRLVSNFTNDSRIQLHATHFKHITLYSIITTLIIITYYIIAMIQNFTNLEFLLSFFFLSLSRWLINPLVYWLKVISPMKGWMLHAHRKILDSSEFERTVSRASFHPVANSSGFINRS